MLNFKTRAVLFLVVSIVGVEAGGRPAPQPGYATGYKSICRISSDLVGALPSSSRSRLSSQPILLENITMPFVQPGEYGRGTNLVRYVSISAGFIEFLNRLAHAKAVESIDRGCYSHYLETLSTQTGEYPLAGLRLSSPEKSWSLNIINHQTSHFNRIAASLLAVDLAHHYLGHYQKYAARLVDARGNAVPINSVVTHDEWHEAVLKGARNALDCGFGTDGLKLLFESFAKMKTRPAWTIYFIPELEDGKKITGELQMVERKFFAF